MVYNYTITAGVTGWLIAQILKTIINFIQSRHFHAERLIGAGGMPSSHTAMVTAATISVARTCGMASTEFALVFLFSAIVVYDAMGVRRAAGLHAREINNMKKILTELINSPLDVLKNGKKVKELQEYIGHTPLEVFCGAILGTIIAFTVPVSL